MRRAGGWKVFACMTDEDLPFVKKRFLEEFEAWTAVEQVPTSRLLTEMPRFRLVAKPMDPRKLEEAAAPATLGELALIKPKRIPGPLTDAQIRDRREMLRQQAALFARNGEAKNT